MTLSEAAAVAIVGRDDLFVPLERANDIETLLCQVIESLRAYKEDVENATFGAMDERCDCDERHCTCVPLLRAKVKRLREENDYLQSDVRMMRNDADYQRELLEELRADVRELLDGVAVNGIPATDRVCEKFLRKYPELG